MQHLRFETTNSAPFPVAEPGTGAAITVCEPFGDPMVAFLKQTGGSDEVIYLSLGLDHEYRRHVTPAGREVISGMGYNPITRTIWCASSDIAGNDVFSFDPETGLEVFAVDLSPDTPLANPRGLGTNGLLFARSAGDRLALHTMSGFRIGEKTYIGRSLTGASAAPSSWVVGDWKAHEIVVIGGFGNEFATAPAPGPDEGIAAVAYDYITNHASMPQIIPAHGIIGPPGSQTHPDTPWNPTPWMGRHRLYVVNRIDEVIYAGYLTAD